MSRRNGNGRKEGPLQDLGKDRAPEDDAAAAKWPNLLALLTPLFDEGKCKRLAGRLTIKILGGYYVVSIACPTEKLQTTAVLRSVVDLFDQLEQHVTSGLCVWLPDFESQKKARQQAKV
jgi:hypothetical protein